MTLTTPLSGKNFHRQGAKNKSNFNSNRDLLNRIFIDQIESLINVLRDLNANRDWDLPITAAWRTSDLVNDGCAVDEAVLGLAELCDDRVVGDDGA